MRSSRIFNLQFIVTERKKTQSIWHLPLLSFCFVKYKLNFVKAYTIFFTLFNFIINVTLPVVWPNDLITFLLWFVDLFFFSLCWLLLLTIKQIIIAVRINYLSFHFSIIRFTYISMHWHRQMISARILLILRFLFGFECSSDAKLYVLYWCLGFMRLKCTFWKVIELLNYGGMKKPAWDLWIFTRIDFICDWNRWKRYHYWK